MSEEKEVRRTLVPLVLIFLFVSFFPSSHSPHHYPLIRHLFFLLSRLLFLSLSLLFSPTSISFSPALPSRLPTLLPTPLSLPPPPHPLPRSLSLCHPHSYVSIPPIIIIKLSQVYSFLRLTYKCSGFKCHP